MTEKEFRRYLKKYLTTTKQTASYDCMDVEMAIQNLLDDESYEIMSGGDYPYITDLVRRFLIWLKPEWKKEKIQDLINDL